MRRWWFFFLLPMFVSAQTMTYRLQNDYAFNASTPLAMEPFDTGDLPAGSVWAGTYTLIGRCWGNRYITNALHTTYYNIPYFYSCSGFTSSFTYPSGSTMACNFSYTRHQGYLDTLIYYWHYPPGYADYYHLIAGDTTDLKMQAIEENYIYSTGTSSARKATWFVKQYNIPQDTTEFVLRINFTITIGGTAGNLGLKWCAFNVTDAGKTRFGGSLLWWAMLRRGSLLIIKRLS